VTVVFPSAVWKRKCQNMQNRHLEARHNWPVYHILRWKVEEAGIGRLRPLTDMEDTRCTKSAQWLPEKFKDSDQFADIVLMRGKRKVVPFRAIKAYCGSGVTSPLIPNLGTNWRRVVNSKPGRFSPEKEPRYRWNRTLIGPQSRYGGCGEENLSCPCRNSNPESPAMSLIILKLSIWKRAKKVISSSHSPFTEFEWGLLIHDSRKNSVSDLWSVQTGSGK